LKIKKILSWTDSGGGGIASFTCPANSVSIFVALAIDGCKNKIHKAIVLC